MLNRKSSKLERVSSPLQAETRTRSALSFDVETGQREPSGEQVTTRASPKSEKTQSTLSRLSLRLFAGRKEPISMEPNSGGETSQESSPMRTSRKMMASDSSDSSADRKDEPRRSKISFSPRSFSLLRISVKASDRADMDTVDQPSEDSLPPDESTIRTPIPGETTDIHRNQDEERGSILRDASSATKTSPRGRFSAKWLSPKRSENSIKPRLPEHIDVSLFEKLESIITHRASRDELVQEMLAKHVDGGSAKVRFVAAVTEFERTQNRSEKQALGKKIISTFLQRNAGFPLPGIPREHQAAVTLDTLDLMRIRVLIDLMEQLSVAEFLASYVPIEDRPSNNSESDG